MNNNDCKNVSLTSNSCYPEHYFDALYKDNTDPWQYQSRWYEKRKRDICLAMLPRPSYNNGIELGCGNGVFSELIAQRCHALLSIDANQHAVDLATQRLANLCHVRVKQGVIPAVLSSLKAPCRQLEPPVQASTPNCAYDLIIISEILYYLSPNEIDKVITWVGQNLAPGGSLLCCHWRYEIEGFEMNGEKVHQRLYQAFNIMKETAEKPVNFTHQSKLVDSDFLLDVWQNSPNTVAMAENLV